MYWLQDKQCVPHFWVYFFMNRKILDQFLINVPKNETGTNVSRTTKKTPLTTFMKGEEWRLFLSFLLKSDKSASFSGLVRSEYKWILYLTTMYVYCVYPAMSKKSENLSDLSKKDRNKRFVVVLKWFKIKCSRSLLKWHMSLSPDFVRFVLLL
jgi:hypothetical protein